MSKRIYLPGETVPTSGQYGAITWSGSVTREVTCVEGEPFPPTRAGERGYVLRDATVHSR